MLTNAIDGILEWFNFPSSVCGLAGGRFRHCNSRWFRGPAGFYDVGVACAEKWSTFDVSPSLCVGVLEDNGVAILSWHFKQCGRALLPSRVHESFPASLLKLRPANSSRSLNR